jgi:hypothetical protein
MAYFITGFSFVPRYCPQFDLINADGSKYRAFLGKHTFGLNMGYRLDETTDPPLSSVCRLARLSGATKILPDIFLVEGDICVNQKVRDAIESVEPLTHQFIPITLMRTKKQAFEGSHYTLVISQKLNSVVFNESNLRWQITPGGSKYVTRGVNRPDYRTLRRSSIEGKHLWREEIYVQDIYMSDELYSNLRNLKVIGIDPTQCTKALEK